MVRKNAVLLLALVGVAAALAVGSASATTGAGAGLPAPKTYVDPGIMGQYVGLFELTQVERRARVIGSEIAIDYTELPPSYPIGRITVRQYDADGRQESWTGTLSSFTGDKTSVHGEILSQGDNSVIGEITLRNPTADGVEGTVTMDGQSYDVAYKRFDDDDGPPADTRVVQTGPRFVAATKPGWGKDATKAIGEWDLVNGVADPGAGAGVYAPIVRLSQSLVSGSGAPTAGTLTVKAASGPGGLAGTLELERPGGRQTLYVTDFKWDGSSRSAVVRSGSEAGPEVGTLKGIEAVGELDLELASDGAKADLVLQRVGS